MPLKQWVIFLPDGFELVCRKETRGGRWLEFAVVLRLGRESIARYDSAHGRPHRDVLGEKSGLIRKEWHENLSLKEAFQYAARDFTANYQKHYRFFKSR